MPAITQADALVLGIRGHAVKQEIFSLVVHPGESVRIGLSRYAGIPLKLSLNERPYGEHGDGGWHFSAPTKPGLYQLHVRRADTGDESQLQLWVSVSRSEMDGESINGYRIGEYPAARTNRDNYEPPDGFIEVTADNLDTPVSTHFVLRQFLCKQQSGYPKYVVLQESLLLLLERLLTQVQAQGFAVDTFGIISGYRTPWYNKNIGNVRYSRHVYGDAMDIFVDSDGDGQMDDLNQDGLRNMDDIILFYDIVEKVRSRPENIALVGGVGKYRRSSRHGGFVHIDTRGYRARW